MGILKFLFIKKNHKKKEQEENAVRAQVKDMVIADAEKELSEAVRAAKASKIKLDWSLQIGHHVRVALEKGGESFENATEEIANKLRDN